MIALCFLGNLRITWFLIDFQCIATFLNLIFLNSKRSFFFKNQKQIFFHTFIFLLLLSASILYNGLTFISIVDVYYLFRPIPLIIYINVIIHRDGYDKIDLLLRVLISVAVVQFIINYPLIILEYLEDPLNIDENNGLFGRGSSHFAGYLWILIGFYFIVNRKNNLIIISFFISSIFLVAIVSNRFFIFGLVYTIILYGLNSGLFNRSFLKILFTFSFLSFAFLIAYSTVEFVNNYVNNYLSVVYFATFKSGGVGLERTKMIIESLEYPFSKFFGEGPGAISNLFFLKGEFANKVNPHLKMNMVGRVIFEYGLLAYFSIVGLYSTFYEQWFKENNIFRQIIIFLSFCIFSYYTRLIQDPRMIYLFTIHCMLFISKNKVPVLKS